MEWRPKSTLQGHIQPKNYVEGAGPRPALIILEKIPGGPGNMFSIDIRRKPVFSFSLALSPYICTLITISSSMPFIATEAISFEELMPRKDRLCPFKPGRMHRGPVPTSWSTPHRSLLDFPFLPLSFSLPGTMNLHKQSEFSSSWVTQIIKSWEEELWECFQNLAVMVFSSTVPPLPRTAFRLWPAPNSEPGEWGPRYLNRKPICNNLKICLGYKVASVSRI